MCGEKGVVNRRTGSTPGDHRPLNKHSCTFPSLISPKHPHLGILLSSAVRTHP